MAPGNPLGLAALVHPTLGAGRGGLVDLVALLVDLVVGPFGCLRGRALAPEPALDAHAGAGSRVALLGLLDCALALGVDGHQLLSLPRTHFGPPGGCLISFPTAIL